MNNRLAKPSAVLALCALLAACGAEREEPFNPPDDDDDSDEFRDPVAVSRIERFEFTDNSADPPGPEQLGKRLEVITDADDFERLSRLYTDFIEAPDFTERTVFLYDSGWRDNSECSQQLLLDQLEAFAIVEDESVTEVVLTYDRQEADDNAECDEDLFYREVAFYSIETQGDIVIVEEVNDLNETSSSSSSSQSSSTSSSSSSDS